MGKLDVSNLRYLSRDDFRVLAAVETGMRNHALVPTELVAAIASLKGGGAHSCLQTLLRCRLVHHDARLYDGYRLTYPGYDFLALRTLFQRGCITGVGRQIGVGKESDIFLVTNEHTGEQMALKLQRLGRVSFRAIKKKRDYLQHRRSASWLYMSMLGARKEFAFMSALHDAGFAVPVPLAHNRHAVLMSLVPGRTLANTRPAAVADPAAVWQATLAFALRLADNGLIHCDLNEFNVMLDPATGRATLIDFPQMVSTSHPNAAELFDRDVGCLVTYFRRRHDFTPPSFPTFASLPPKSTSLDVRVEASGFFSAQQARAFEQLMADRARDEAENDKGDENDEDDDGIGDNKVEEGPEGISRHEPAGEASARASGSDPATSAAGESLGGGAFVAVAPEVLERLDGEVDGDGNVDSDAGGIYDAGASAGSESKEASDGDEAGDQFDDDDDEEVDDGPEARRMEAASEAALALLRPPEGVRTRPGGRRIKTRGGEAYLNSNGSTRRGSARDGVSEGAGAAGAGAEDGAGSVVSRRSLSSTLSAADDVHGRVKRSLGKAREKKERASIVGRAVSANDNKKHVGLARNIGDHVAASRAGSEAFW